MFGIARRNDDRDHKRFLAFHGTGDKARQVAGQVRKPNGTSFCSLFVLSDLLQAKLTK
jgi:hypothetical protein